MSETGPEHPLTYRKKIVKQFFQLVQGAESGSVVGAASMGKTRLIGFVLRPDVRQHYLGSEADDTLLIHVDCNRISEHNEWGLYELILMTLAEVCAGHPKAIEIIPGLFSKNNNYNNVIKSRNVLATQRFLELVVDMLCSKLNMNLAFLFDEFDQTLQDLPAKTFANLRGLRDRNKSKLCFILFLRSLPKMLRNVNDHEFEGFYELLSKSTIGLLPYEIDDCSTILRQLEQRFHFSLSSTERDWVLHHCAGHPGLLLALFHIQRQKNLTEKIEDDPARIAALPTISDECRKIFSGLLPDERKVLLDLTHEQHEQVANEFYELLRIKGLVVAIATDRIMIFNPIFRFWVSQQTL